MSGTCIGHTMRASVRPCLGHGIGIETSASVRDVWAIHRPRDARASVRPCLGHGISLEDDNQCKTMTGTWHQPFIPCLRLMECPIVFRRVQ
ncbi:hypothetical protein F383_31937 [Gossypium arboreum]|uniref:Uncharacterized protein n=1 Tax=Gossypium arboreum TaxID=29729 RepID=A0A0B0MYN8_GOSAR|nr:hypothetical protein F383_31937 [Gossypium arboreum]